MTRRSILKMLAALPFCGAIGRAEAAEPGKVGSVLPQIGDPFPYSGWTDERYWLLADSRIKVKCYDIVQSPEGLCMPVQMEAAGYVSMRPVWIHTTAETDAHGGITLRYTADYYEVRREYERLARMLAGEKLPDRKPAPQVG